MALDPPTGWVQSDIDDFFNNLADQGRAAAYTYVSTRTPDYLQPYYDEFLAGYDPNPLPPNETIVSDGQVIALAGGASVTLGVANNVVSATLVLPANQVVVSNNDRPKVVDINGTEVAGSPGIAEVTSSTLNDIRLTA